MTVVAVTGARGPLGSALCALLSADERVERVIAVDVEAPEMPAGKVEFRPADVRDPVLPRIIEDAETIVHLGTWVPEPVSEQLHFAVVVQGTRNVLAAAEKVGAGRLVHLSSAMVYGADASNEVPLDEEAHRQVSPDAARPYHRLLAEELATGFGERHPGTTVVVLRPATVLGLGLESPETRLLEAPRIPMVVGYEPTFQVLDAGDLVRALALAVTGDLQGAYNVAADGWVTAGEAAALLGRRPLRIPEAPLMAALEAARSAGLSDLSPGHMAYLMHPWVVDTARLRGAGWRPERSHREVLRAFAEAHGSWLRVGGLRLHRRHLYGGGMVAAAISGAIAWKAARTVRKRLER